jgi:hypothetical protein
VIITVVVVVAAAAVVVVCLYVCLYVCLSVCLIVCLFASLPLLGFVSFVFFGLAIFACLLFVDVVAKLC